MSKFPALPLKLKNLLNTFARKQPNLVIFNIFIFDWSNYIIIYTCNLTPSVLIFERLVVYSSWNLNHGSAPFWLLGFGSSKKCGSTDPDSRCEISTKNCKNKKIQGTILFFFSKIANTQQKLFNQWILSSCWFFESVKICWSWTKNLLFLVDWQISAKMSVFCL